MNIKAISIISSSALALAVGGAHAKGHDGGGLAPESPAPPVVAVVPLDAGGDPQPFPRGGDSRPAVPVPVEFAALADVDGKESKPLPRLGRELGEPLGEEESDEELDAAFKMTCEDKPTFQFNDKARLSCANIASKRRLRRKLCTRARVQQNCPVTCGVCGKPSKKLCNKLSEKNECLQLSCCSWNRRAKKCHSRVRNKECFAAQKRDKSDVLNEYDELENVKISTPGLIVLYDNPPVKTLLSRHKSNITREIFVVDCSTRCNTHEEVEGTPCTTFVMYRTPEDFDEYDVECILYNNDANEYNPLQVVSHNGGPKIGYFDTYHSKSAQALQDLKVAQNTLIEGLFPDDQSKPDFPKYALPAIQCAGQVHFGKPDGCKNCFLANRAKTCRGNAAAICGYGKDCTGKSDAKALFMDGVCGKQCFSGKEANYKCLPEMQKFALAVYNQPYTVIEGLGAGFGCAMSNIKDPENGTVLPNYTCPPHTNQPVPVE